MPEPSAGLVALIDANAPLWAGEAEVFRTYWDWPGRSRQTDLAWIARQCYKELFDGFLPRLAQLQQRFRAMDAGVERAAVLEAAESAYEELAHYCAFADAYDALREGEPPLQLQRLEDGGNWPENAELGELRRRHRSEHGELGERAQAFTEGGYCTLYSEGTRLAGRGGADDVIARACSVVYDDEWEHMLQGIAGLDDEGIDPPGWETLTRLTVEQMRLRARMRNAQFGRPLAESRVAEIEAGETEPLRFDYERAGFGGDGRPG